MNNFVNNVNKQFTHIENNFNVYNRNGWNRFSNNWNRNNYWGNWNRYARPVHGNWYHGCWHGNHGSAWGYGAGLVTGALVSNWIYGPSVYNSGYYAYSNPYYTEPLIIQQTTGPETIINYSQPLQVTVPVVNESVKGGEDVIEFAPIPEVTVNAFEAARTAFAEGDYGTALNKANEALGATPNDPVIHQFRSLVLFAQKEYRQATAGLYSVLSVGPPWDWTTMSGLYGDVDVYTAQFQSLESFVEQNPDAGYAHFLFGYHCMICGHNETAIEQFKTANKLDPSDTLAASLVRMLGGTTGEESLPTPSSQEEFEDLDEISPDLVLGQWKSSRESGPQISLRLDQNGKFAWTVTQGQDSNKLEGEFSLAANKLALQSDSNQAMIGTISNADGKGFNFRIVGAPPGDKGIDFVKQ